MNHTVTSKYNVGDSVLLSGPGGGLRCKVLQVFYDDYHKTFMYIIDKLTNPVREGDLW